MKKRFLSCVLAGVAAVALASCGGANLAANQAGNAKSANKFTVWAAEAAQELTVKQLQAFCDAEKVDALFTVEKVSEADSATQMITDVQGGADLFCFAQDQFARLVQAGALQKIGGSYAQFVKENNDKGSVGAVTSGSDIYAYPLTSDNGYFMYYDKTVVNPSHVDSLQQVMDDCVAAGKMFSMEVETSAWYIASWFFAVGCQSEWSTDDEGNFTGLNDDFKSAKGLIAAKAMKNFYNTLGDLHYSNSVMSNAASAAIPSAVVVSGTWDYKDAEALFGDNLGIADLPSFVVDGQTYHMGSYSGNKLLGIKPTTDANKAIILNKAAQYLTSEAQQLERFQTLGWGPSNMAAQANDAVKADPALSALAQQNNYATPQGQILGAWWDIAKVIGTGIKESDGTDAGLMAVLEKYDTDIRTALAYPDGMIWVGSNTKLNGQEFKAWTNAVAKVLEAVDGVITIEVTFEKNADGTDGYYGGRFTQNLNWDGDKGYQLVTDEASLELINTGNGDGNIEFKEAGTYVLVFNTTTNKITVSKK